MVVGPFNRDHFNPNHFACGQIASGDIRLSRRRREEVLVSVSNEPVYGKIAGMIESAIRKFGIIEVSFFSYVRKRMIAKTLISSGVLKRGNLEASYASPVMKKMRIGSDVLFGIQPFEQTQTKELLDILSTTQLKDVLELVGDNLGDVLEFIESN